MSESVASEVRARVSDILAAAERLGESPEARAEQRAEARLREADARLRDAEAEAAERLRAADAEAARRVASAEQDAERIVADRRSQLSSLAGVLFRSADVLGVEVERSHGVSEQLRTLGRELQQTADTAQLGADASPRQPTPRGGGEAPSEPPTPDAASAAARSGPTAEDRDRGAALAAVPPPEGEAGRAAVAAQEEGERETALETPAGPAPNGYDRADGARQVALQMAMAGGTRGEVAGHLRRALDMRDPHQLLDEVFGRADSPGSGAPGRVPEG